MKLVMSPEYRKAFPCVTRWFTTCVNQPQFEAVIGTVELAKEEMTAEGAPPAPKKEKVSPLSLRSTRNPWGSTSNGSLLFKVDVYIMHLGFQDQ